MPALPEPLDQAGLHERARELGVVEKVLELVVEDRCDGAQAHVEVGRQVLNNVDEVQRETVLGLVAETRHEDERGRRRHTA
eukprot:13538276-Alexandrium_andersonii.AAC.1